MTDFRPYPGKKMPDGSTWKPCRFEPLPPKEAAAAVRDYWRRFGEAWPGVPCNRKAVDALEAGWAACERYERTYGVTPVQQLVGAGLLSEEDARQLTVF